MLLNQKAAYANLGENFVELHFLTFVNAAGPLVELFLAKPSEPRGQ